MTKVLLIAVALLSGIAAVARAGDDSDLRPYLEGAEHTISTREYSDLKSYVERAQKSLVRTLETSTAFSGVELRDYLLRGIRAALDSSSLRSELLLFNYALERAVTADAIYVGRNFSADRAQLSAQVILIPLIETALKYYQMSDVPRLSSTIVPSPDWLGFAAEQVPYLLRSIDLAPSRQQRIEMAKTALGWTARSLNSSLDRRDVKTADLIVQLGELYNDPNPSHPTYVSRAQDALLAVFKAFRQPLPVLNAAPASSGADLRMRKSVSSGTDNQSGSPDFFPLFGTGFGGAVGFDKTGESSGSSDSLLKNVEMLRFSANVSLGGISTNDGVSSDSRMQSAANVDARLVYFGESDGLYGGVNVETSMQVSPTLDGKWNYSVKAQGGACVFFGVGATVAIEAANYGRFEEVYLRGGWSPQMFFRIGEKEYVLLQGLVGPFYAGCGSADANMKESAYCKAGYLFGPAIGGRVLVQKKRFSVSVEGTAAWGVSPDSDTVDEEDPQQKGARIGIDSNMIVPLGFFLRNDALILKAQLVNYAENGPSRRSLMFFYGLNW